MRKLVWVLLLGACFGQTVPPTLFGLHWQKQSPWPAVPFGSLRLWDTATRWQQLEPAANFYNWSQLDSYLLVTKQHGLPDVLLTLSGTPKWASSDPTNASCDYHTVATGSCGPPLLLNADGTGKNQYWRDFVYNLAKHLSGLAPNLYSSVQSFSGWNEFSRSTSWKGTPAQLVRLMQDANCILTGRGQITATGETCTAANMQEPAVGLLPTALLATPDSVLSAPDSTVLKTYYATSGAMSAADFLAAHAYVQNGICCAAPETIITRANTFTSISAAPKPKWSTEGSWGQSTPNLPDPDAQAAFVSRYYLLGWSNGISRLYWYSYDNPSWGTLWTSSGLTKAGVAYATTYSWMVGNSLTKPCSAVGTVWTCEFSTSAGLTLAIWNTAQTSAFSYPAQYGRFQTLDGQIQELPGGTVSIGAKPIMLLPADRPAAPTGLSAVVK